MPSRAVTRRHKPSRAITRRHTPSHAVTRHNKPSRAITRRHTPSRRHLAAVEVAQPPTATPKKDAESGHELARRRLHLRHGC